ncbi:hypothetical protein OLR75_10365, partial [Campylobacter jejuni]|nr:hypothetical protein [Campylobacter jejuni]
DNEKSLNKKIVSNEEKEKITCPKCQKGFLREINGKFGNSFLVLNILMVVILRQNLLMENLN